MDLRKIKEAYTSTLEPVFPTVAPVSEKADTLSYSVNKTWKAKSQIKPQVFIPAFPGTNCEYDTARAFERAGASVKTILVRNLTPSDILQSIKEMKTVISESQIIAFPGGFSLGDEPDGSGKFIATAFRNPELMEAVLDLLYKRDGLALGICNGFQALIKLGLLPFGQIVPQDKDSATLTYNKIGRHVSTMANIRIASNNSPWLSGFRVGDVFSVPISHGEGRIVAPASVIEKIIKGGQVATQYCDDLRKATMVSPFNPNGSTQAIEGLLSTDGRVLGKMGHSERWQDGLYQNLSGRFNMDIFKNGVNYFN
jgi:phosphoribosylformylglycinamidine synthase